MPLRCAEFTATRPEGGAVYWSCCSSAAGDIADDIVSQLKGVNCGPRIDLIVSQGQTHAVGGARHCCAIESKGVFLRHVRVFWVVLAFVGKRAGLVAGPVPSQQSGLPCHHRIGGCGLSAGAR